MESLTAAKISKVLGTRWLGKSLQVLPEVDSTNSLLKEMVRQGDEVNPPSGFLLLTEYQRQGRGRLNRSWEAAPGTSLLLSLLFRPNWPAARMNWLTMLVSLAATEAVEALTGLNVGLKWPNDLMVRQSGAWHKLSGLLLEGDFDPNGRLKRAIVGIGINVNIPVAELPEGIVPATSLLAAVGQEVDRLPLLVRFLNRVEKLYDLAENGRSPQPEWQKKLINLGKTVQVTYPQTEQTITGIAEATDEAGHLLVRDASGTVHTITAADVTLRPS